VSPIKEHAPAGPAITGVILVPEGTVRS